jgi:single-strand DNA-binding protein
MSVTGLNVVALAGRLSRPAERRVLPSGDDLVAYDVSTPGRDGKQDSVPVVWFNAPATATTLDTDDKVVVVGRVRRRFFRAGGATQSRTEVVADAVVPARQAKRVRAALDAAADVLLGDDG